MLCIYWSVAADVVCERMSLASRPIRKPLHLRSSGATLPGDDHVEEFEWRDAGKFRLGFALRYQLWVQLILATVLIGIPTWAVDHFASPRSRFFLSADPTISYPTNDVCGARARNLTPARDHIARISVY